MQVHGGIFMFEYQTTIQLHNTDAAGIMFFANYFKLAHDAYEAFLESIGFSIRDMLDKLDFLLVIVHAEADFKVPYRLGEQINITIYLEKVSNSSLVFQYDFLNSNQEKTGYAKTVHVSINKKTNQKQILPESLRLALDKIM